MRVTPALLLLAACSANPSPEECSQVGSSGRTFSASITNKYASGCATPGDCTLVRPMLGCYTGCPAAVLRSRASTVQGELTVLAESVCAGTACEVNEGCRPAVAVCVGGVCRAVEPDGGTADAGSRDGG